jgi:Uma2 family endonuclease
MVSTQPATGLTYEDYLKTSDDERWELLDGELVMAPSPSMPHQIVATDLVTLLNSFVRERGLGHVITAPADVVLSDTNVVQPDLFFVSTEREQIITRPNIQGAPDERDRTVKRKLYAEHGVKEYWLVDPDAMTVTVLLHGERDFEEAGVYRKGQTLTSPTLQGFSVNLDDIFRP